MSSVSISKSRTSLCIKLENPDRVDKFLGIDASVKNWWLPRTVEPVKLLTFSETMFGESWFEESVNFLEDITLEMS